jgi:hypothetical protein
MLTFLLSEKLVSRLSSEVKRYILWPRLPLEQGLTYQESHMSFTLKAYIVLLTMLKKLDVLEGLESVLRL